MQLVPTKIPVRFRLWSKRTLPLVIHSNTSETILPCLAMIAKYYDSDADLATIETNFRYSPTGSKMDDIVKFSEQASLSCRLLHIKSEEITQLKLPCVIRLKSSIFIVIKKIKSKSAIIHDPIRGEVKLTIDQLHKDFSGEALVLSPLLDFVEKDIKAKLKLTDLCSKVFGLKRSLLLIFSLSLLLHIFILASPYYIQLVIDDVIKTGDNSLLSILAIGFFAVMVFEVITASLRRFALVQLGNQINDQLGVNLYRHLLRLPLQYFETRHMGDIVSKFGSLQPIRRLLTQGVIEAIIDGLMAVITLFIIYFYSPLLSAVVVCTVVLYALVRLAIYKPEKRLMKQELNARAQENSNFMESIRGIQTIKLFGAEKNRESIWHNYHTLAINETIKLSNIQITQNAVNLFLFGLENLLVIYFAAKLVISGSFSTGMLFAFIAYKGLFVAKTRALIEKLFEFILLDLHFERIADIVQTPKEKTHTEVPIKHEIKGKIELRDVSYKYSDCSTEIISNLNIMIKAGESVAITGPSASGKTTLLKLMLGLNTPEKGSVLIDDIPIEHIGNFQYRNQVAAVMQDDVLLSGSIAENIAFFEQLIDMERVVYCADLAAIHDDINKMPLGYDSQVADMGSRLSGGQKQRIILARALYKKPKILFMDEATSHLDTELEADINEAIKSLQITRVIIAHRQETISSAERIINLLNLDYPLEEQKQKPIKI